MKTRLFLLLIAVSLFATQAYTTPTIDEGKAIFTTRCAACHNINKTLTGPALAGIDKKRSIDWIISFVKSSQSMVKSGDKDAIAIFEQFSKIPMPDHPDFSDDQIKSILEYIISESKPAENAAAPFAIPLKIRPDFKPFTTSDYGFFIGFLAVVVLLIMVLLFAVQAKSFQREMRNKKFSS